MPQKFSRVWTKQDGNGTVVEVDHKNKSAFVLWDNGSESGVQLDGSVHMGNRPRR